MCARHIDQNHLREPVLGSLESLVRFSIRCSDAKDNMDDEARVDAFLSRSEEEHLHRCSVLLVTTGLCSPLSSFSLPIELVLHLWRLPSVTSRADHLYRIVPCPAGESPLRPCLASIAVLPCLVPPSIQVWGFRGRARSIISAAASGLARLSCMKPQDGAQTPGGR